MPWSILGLAAHPEGRMHHIITVIALNFKSSSRRITLRSVTDGGLQLLG